MKPKLYAARLVNAFRDPDYPDPELICKEYAEIGRMGIVYITAPPNYEQKGYVTVYDKNGELLDSAIYSCRFKLVSIEFPENYIGIWF